MAHYRVRKLFALPLVAALSFNAVALGSAQAAMVPTTDVIRDSAVSSADRDRVNTFMEREEVRREIEKLGVDPDEAALRVSALSDEEIASIAERLDQLPAGEGAVGAVVGAALIVFRFFDVSNGIEEVSERGGDQVDHGDVGGGVSVSACLCPSGLEETVEALHAGVAVA